MNTITVDAETCRRELHHLKLVGSDKTPMKRSLACLTCSARTGRDAYAAYGKGCEELSFGEWKSRYEDTRGTTEDR